MKHLDLFELLNDLYQRYMPETVYLVKNQPRHEEAMRSLWRLISFVTQEDETAEVSFSKNELIGTSLALDIKTYCFATTNVQELCDLLKQVDSLDVVPLTDGRVCLTVGFDNVYKPYEPNEKRGDKQ